MSDMQLVKLLGELPTGVVIPVKNPEGKVAGQVQCEAVIVKLKENEKGNKWMVSYQYFTKDMIPKPVWAVMGVSLVECLDKAIKFAREVNHG